MPRAVTIAGAIGFALLSLGACKKGTSHAPSPAHHRLSLWHTFNGEETATLNRALARLRKKQRVDVRVTVIPFAQAQNTFRRAAADCGPDAPDLFRAELPWIAGFVSRGLLVAVPQGAPAEGDYLKAASAAAKYRGRRWALPASVDCLALLYHRDLLTTPPRAIEQFVTTAKRLTVDAAGRPATDKNFDPKQIKRWGFYVRADGYWFLPFLWANGGRLLDPARGKVFVDSPAAVAALDGYRALVATHKVAPGRTSPSNDYEDQLRRFGKKEVAMIVNGPWATAAILKQPAFAKHKDNLGVAPFPLGKGGAAAAPLSGHGYVVSRCSKNPAAAWRLAQALSDADAQALFAKKNALLPALASVYRRPELMNNSLIQGFRAALENARPRPQHPVMSRIFDDFTPAVQAVVLGQASAKEALQGVAAAWRRLLQPPASSPASAPATSRPATSQPIAGQR